MTDTLIQKSLALGVSRVQIIDPKKIVVEDRFPEICRTSKCPGFGRAPGCPPHVMKTDAFRELLSRYESALVFSIDAPAGMLMTDDWQEVARLVHQMSGAIERLAVEEGYENSRGFAAGSCKQLFCNDVARCVVLEKKGKCPHEHEVRPSISGVGISFNELCRELGWEASTPAHWNEPDKDAMSMMIGLVLVG